MKSTDEATTTIHGVFIKVFNHGVLLLGKSGVGKSECAIDLITRHHQLIADDSILITRQQDNKLVGRASSHLPYHMSIRGLGIISIRDIFGPDHVCEQNKIDLVVELSDHDGLHKYDDLGMDEKFYSILGVKIKHLQIPATKHKNLANIIEVAVKNELLKKAGTNSALIFNQKLNEKFIADKTIRPSRIRP